MSKTAVILAAGKAQRMRPLSQRRPKGMFLLAGKPVIEHAIDAVRSLGVERFVIVVDATDVTIRSFFGDGSTRGISIDYVLQHDAGGTATAMRLVDREEIKDGAFIVPANVFIEPKTVASMGNCNGPTTLLAKATGDHVQGVPTVRGDRMVAMTSEEPTVGNTRVSTGIHWIDAAFLEALHGPLKDEKYLDAAMGVHSEEHLVEVKEADGVWEPLIDPWDIVRINERAMASMDVHIGEHVDVHETAVLVPPVWIGDGTHIGERSVIGPHVAIRTNARIGALCEIRDSVINNNVRIDTRAVVRGAIIDDGSGIGPGFLAPNGAIVGADASLGSGIVFEGPELVDAKEKVPSGLVRTES